jgi:hypothetical protein
MNNLNYEFDVESFESGNDAEAALALNNNMNFAKFIFTTATPNKNKQRIPEEEFDNIIKTGVFMPFKMGVGKIEEGHNNARPIGVITQLKKENGKVVAIAGLWKEESQTEIHILKENISKNNLPQVSWELNYDHSTISDDGYEDLHGVTVRATTVVGRPAYAGETPILAVASENSKTEENKLELEELQTKITELETEISRLNEVLTSKDTEISTLTQEKEALAQFKTEIEQKEAEAQKFASIKTKFSESGINKADTYFEENKEKLMAFDENELDFFIQTIVSFTNEKLTTASEDNGIPPISDDTERVNLKDPKALGKALRDARIKK